MVWIRNSKDNRMTRRAFVFAGASAAAAIAFRPRDGAYLVEARDGTAKEVTIIQFSTFRQRKEAVIVPMIIKPDSEWKQQLSPDAYDVTRRAGTEMPYSGQYWNLHDKGVYQCICCDTPLFSSETKFESGTGWPSFWQPIAKENVRETADLSFGMERTAVSCRRCDPHLGHVFDDGPRPTGLRYCMNSVALKFEKFV